MSLHTDTVINNTLEAKRRLLLQKDLFELLHWMDEMEHLHAELAKLTIIERQLIQKNSLALNIQSVRRKNTLLMGAFCKYEQHIKTEIDYGKTDYDMKRSKEHEKQRDHFRELLKEHRLLKSELFDRLSQLQKKP